MQNRLSRIWTLLKADWIIPSRRRILTNMIWHKLTGKSYQMLPPLPDGRCLHVGAGQDLVDGYENLDGYSNDQRPDHFQTTVTKFCRAETLDCVYATNSVAEIRCHHVFEHISILDVDRTLQGWNRVLEPGGLVWIQVPDFEGCVRQIRRLKTEAEKEIYYRHIFGSQMGPGELHKNGFTASRLIALLSDYGFETCVAYVEWIPREPLPVVMSYPCNLPLPDLTIKAIKIGPPKPEIVSAEYTPILYRKMHPNPDLEA